MKNLYFSLYTTVIIVISFLSCNGQKSDSGFVFYYTRDTTCDFVFVVKDSIQGSWKLVKRNKRYAGDDPVFKPVYRNQTDYDKIQTYYRDSIPFSKMNFDAVYRNSIPFSEMNFDTVEIATSQSIFSPISIGGQLFNARITKALWTVSVYSFFDELQGTFELIPTPSEDSVFQTVLSHFVQRVDKKYAPYMGPVRRFIYTDEFKFYRPPAIYLNIIEKGKQTEYFGTSVTPPEEYAMLQIIATLIVENHLLVFKDTKRIDDRVRLTDIREKFNKFVQKDNKTGVIITDIRAQLQPPPPPPAKK